MRTAHLIFLIFFAAASCDMRPSSGSAEAQVMAAVPASLPSRPTENERPAEPQLCGYAFEAASPTEAADFLRDLTGLWRDELSVPELVGDRAIIDGLSIGEGSLIPVRLDAEHATIVEQSPFPSVVIGPMAADGFRIVQLTWAREFSCAVYSFKIERRIDGTALSLLVRGPLSPRNTEAPPPSAFQAATQDSTRIFLPL